MELHHCLTSGGVNRRGAQRNLEAVDWVTPSSRGTITGKQVTGPPLSEAEHFRRCPLCGGYVDMRESGWLDDHQGPLPHPACDRVQ